MTARGSVYTQFRREIEAGHVDQAMMLALEMPKVQLPDAIDLAVALAAARDARYPAAARRCLERFIVEAKPELDQVADVAEALAELEREPTSELARDVLAEAGGRRE